VQRIEGVAEAHTAVFAGSGSAAVAAAVAVAAAAAADVNLYLKARSAGRSC